MQGEGLLFCHRRTREVIGLFFQSTHPLAYPDSPLTCHYALSPCHFFSRTPPLPRSLSRDPLWSPLLLPCLPLAHLPNPLLCFFVSSDAHLSAFPSWPLALALAPASAAPRAPRAPRTSRAVGTPRRIATSGRAGAGSLAMAQEAWSAVWKPGLFCSTTQKCS